MKERERERVKDEEIESFKRKSGHDCLFYKCLMLCYYASLGTDIDQWTFEELRVVSNIYRYDFRESLRLKSIKREIISRRREDIHFFCSIGIFI